MSQFEIHTSLKFRKSVFTLFYNFIKAVFACGAFSFLISYIETPIPAIFVFMVSLIFVMLCICVDWHFRIVEVKGNILEIKSGFWFRQKKSFSIEYIQEINVKQSIIGKYLKYGNLVITAPTIDQSIIIKNLDNVRRLSEFLNDYARDHDGEGFVITA
jgi:uncharacterized membrane protein YdbT with pleckstrin-like domain